MVEKGNNDAPSPAGSGTDIESTAPGPPNGQHSREPPDGGDVRATAFIAHGSSSPESTRIAFIASASALLTFGFAIVLCVWWSGGVVDHGGYHPLDVGAGLPQFTMGWGRADNISTLDENGGRVAHKKERRKQRRREREQAAAAAAAAAPVNAVQEMAAWWENQGVLMLATVKVAEAVAMPRAFSPMWSVMHEHFSSAAAGPAGSATNTVFLGDSITEEFLGTFLERGTRIGDSSPAHLRTVWDARFASLPALNFGVAGVEARNLLWRLQNDELSSALRPRVVVLNVGTNDLGRQRVLEEVSASVAAIVTYLLHEWPDTAIIVVGLLPRGGRSDSPLWARVQEINERLRGLETAAGAAAPAVEEAAAAEAPAAVAIATAGAAAAEEEEEEEAATAALAAARPAGLFGGLSRVRFVDCTSWVVVPDRPGQADVRYMPDQLHLSAEGLGRYANCLSPHITDLMASGGGGGDGVVSRIGGGSVVSKHGSAASTNVGTADRDAGKSRSRDRRRTRRRLTKKERESGTKKTRTTATRHRTLGAAAAAAGGSDGGRGVHGAEARRKGRPGAATRSIHHRRRQQYGGGGIIGSGIGGGTIGHGGGGGFDGIGGGIAGGGEGSLRRRHRHAAGGGAAKDMRPRRRRPSKYPGPEPARP